MWPCMYEVQAISQDQGNLPLEYSLLPSITMVPLCTRVAVFLLHNVLPQSSGTFDAQAPSTRRRSRTCQRW